MRVDVPAASHLLLAFALTYALGFERQLRGSPAGNRTFALIGVGSGVVGKLAESGAPNALAGAITGVGFIGAGMMFRSVSTHREVVSGLTSAAGIFAAAGIGAAAGQGAVALSVLATVLALFVLEMRYLPGLRMLDAARWVGRVDRDAAEPGGVPDPYEAPAVEPPPAPSPPGPVGTPDAPTAPAADAPRAGSPGNPAKPTDPPPPNR